MNANNNNPKHKNEYNNNNKYTHHYHHHHRVVDHHQTEHSKENKPSQTIPTLPSTPQPILLPGFILDPITNKYFKIPHSEQRNASTPRFIQTLLAQSNATVQTPKPNFTISVPKMHQLLCQREIGWKSHRPSRTRRLFLENRYNTSLKETKQGNVGVYDCTYLDIAQNKTNKQDNLLCISGKKNGVDTIKVFKNIQKGNIDTHFHKLVQVNNSVSSLKCCWNQSMHTYTLLVSELGNMYRPGGFTIYDENLNSMLNFSLSKGSLWVCETNQTGFKVVSGGTKCVMFEDLITQTFYRIHKQKSDVFSTRFLTDNVIVFGSRDGSIKIFDVRTKSCIISMDQRNSISDILHLVSNNNHIIASSLNGTMNRWDLRLQKVVQSYHYQNNEYSHCKMTLSDNDDFLFSGGQDKKIRIWNSVSGSLVSTLAPFDSVIVNIGKLDNSILVADGAFKSFEIS